MTTARPRPTFASFAQNTINKAGRLVDPELAHIVEQAWIEVGVLVDPTKSWFGWMLGRRV